MASLGQPKLLLLDEHTASLDPRTAEQVLELTQTIVHKHGLTVLMVTHNLSHALKMGNRTIMLDKGGDHLRYLRARARGVDGG